jgi:hypothetical protein
MAAKRQHQQDDVIHHELDHNHEPHHHDSLEHNDDDTPHDYCTRYHPDTSSDCSAEHGSAAASCQRRFLAEQRLVSRVYGSIPCEYQL